jgi:hypothetical protein
MKGVITVGSGGGSGPTTTAANGAGSNVALVTTPKAGGAPVGRPAGHLLAGWGLFAVGALLALMLIALYALHPRRQPPEAPRGGGRIAGPLIASRGRRRFELDDNRSFAWVAEDHCWRALRALGPSSYHRHSFTGVAAPWATGHPAVTNDLPDEEGQ